MAPRPPGTSVGTPSFFTDTVCDSCTSVTWSEFGRGSLSSCSGTTVLTSGAVRFSFLPLVLAVLVAPALGAPLEVSTQWPVSLKHTGSDLLPESVVAAGLELELGLLGAGAVEEGVDDAGAEEG